MQHSRKIKRRFSGLQGEFRKNLIDPSQLVALRNPYRSAFGLIDPSQLVALRNPRSSKIIEEIKFDLWEGALSQQEIARKYGVTQGHISQIAKKAGMRGGAFGERRGRPIKRNPYISMFQRNPISRFRRNPIGGFRRNPDPEGNPWGPKLYNPIGDSTHEFKDETHYQRMIAKLRRNPFRGY
jgi:hypothetical protein